MLKSLQWKMVTIFVLLVMAIMAATGTFLVLSVTNVYYSMFADEMDSIFTESLIEQMETGTALGEDYIQQVLSAYTARMGIDSYRNYYIIDANSARVIDSSAPAPDSFSMHTQNLIVALSGDVGNYVSPQASIMDYAVPIRGEDFSYIIYVHDTKEELTAIIQRIFSIILQALLLGVTISLVMGYFLSRTITTPIANLTQKAKGLAEGEFESKIDVKSEDEIGTLTETFNDMSAKLQEAMLQMSTEKNKVEAILLNMTDGVMTFATDGNLIHINPTARKMFSLSDEETLQFDEFFAQHQVDIRLGDLLYLEDNRFMERDIELQQVSVKAGFVVFEDELDNTGSVLVVLHDITRQQKLENSRREFVANVSHELRTPLTTIKSYAETLLDMAEGSDMPVSFINTIVNETDRMTRLVKDLLVLSSLERSDQLKKTEFNMAVLLSDVVDTMELVARDQGHRLKLKVNKPLGNFYGDRDRLEQLLYNIISNSIKYTPNGGKIDVTAGQVYRSVYIKVKDTGIGIPEKDLGRLFERFYRVDKARSREQGGTGLGLAISKSIVEAHGGTISIASKINQGTEVTISLPVLPIEQQDT
ncbi:MAG: cell wall metabolism sensor histidine kinase WalK [Ruminococcaceae bacterium]|nr:cell wall metabolism sensor histidine kinase WalK [Oscillospiraceae bacterium]